MPIRIETNAEPIPGYRLMDRLGSGGFGEVWSAEAPGGLFKAIKFVKRGAPTESDSMLSATDPDRSRADQEWKSLMRVKTVRHPFILLLDRFENIDNYLVIVMELADRTLADRFKECRSQGLPGIPRDELIGYLMEAAEVLDLMNSQYQLQHLDIKPQNLFLVHNHIKVADFGLVKDTTAGKNLMTITGGVTPVYAAPETFDGQFSRQSDQYSLAIVYQEMLTGQRPFTGTTMKQLVLQHVQNAHDLTPSPAHDRPVLARALAKNPEDRFLTCTDFVQTLKHLSSRAGALPEPQTGPSPPPTNRAGPAPQHKTQGVRGLSGLLKRAEPNFPDDSGYFEESPSAEAANCFLPGSGPSSAKTSDLAEDSSGLGRKTPVEGIRRKAHPSSTVNELPGVIQPALVIGIGQLGVETLSQLRQMVATEFGTPAALPQVRLLAIDTDSEPVLRTAQNNPRGALRTHEAFQTKLQRPSHYLKTRDGKLPTEDWLSSKLLHRIPREQQSAGLRPLGRLAFVDNYRALHRRIEGELAALCSQDTAHDSDANIDLGLRTTRPRVYVVASLTGNTGGGMFVDVAYLVRKLLDELGQQDAEVVGIFYVPAVRREPAVLAPLANSYAALVELRHYCQPEAIFSAQYVTAASTAKADCVATTGPAFQRSILLALPDSKGKPSETDNAAIVASAGSFLFRDLATILGQAFDEQRAGKLNEHGDPPSGVLLQSVGTYRIHWPRHDLLEKAARHLCSQLIARWLNKDASLITDTIRQWTAERWDAICMRPENLIENFQQLAEKALGKKPELALGEILAPIQLALNTAPPGPNKTQSNLHLGTVVKAMENLERLIGTPDEGASSKLNFEPSTLETTLADVAMGIADECEKKLAGLAVQLLEDPHYRLAGAEEALRQFSLIAEQSLQSQETLAKELTDKSALLYQRIHQMLDMPVNTATSSQTHWSFRMGRLSTTGAPGASSTDVFELVRTYTKTRYHSLVLTHLNRLYLGLRGHLSDQIREVGFCRQRLGELKGFLEPSTAPVKTPVTPNERALFPPGCADLKDAVEKLVASITLDDLVVFDLHVQEWINTHFQALLEICMGSSAMVRNLAPALLLEAEAFLGDRVQGGSVAEMYVQRKRAEFAESADEMIRDDLQRCLDDATPELGRLSAANDITIVSFPNDAAGRELRDLLKSTHPEAKVLLSDRPDEMVFYHEAINIQWKDLEQFGPAAREAYERRCNADPSSLHTREDVFEWQLIVESNR